MMFCWVSSKWDNVDLFRLLMRCDGVSAVDHLGVVMLSRYARGLVLTVALVFFGSCGVLFVPVKPSRELSSVCFLTIPRSHSFNPPPTWCFPKCVFIRFYVC